MYFGVGWMEYHRKYTGLHKSINGTLDAEDINCNFNWSRCLCW